MLAPNFADNAPPSPPAQAPINFFDPDTLNSALKQYEDAILGAYLDATRVPDKIPEEEALRPIFLAERRACIIYREDEESYEHALRVGVSLEAMLHKIGADQKLARDGLVIGLLHDAFAQENPPARLEERLQSHHGKSVPETLKRIALRGAKVIQLPDLLNFIDQIGQHVGDRDVYSIQTRLLACLFTWVHQTYALDNLRGRDVDTTKTTATKLSVDLMAARIESILADPTAPAPSLREFLETHPQGQQYRLPMNIPALMACLPSRVRRIVMPFTPTLPAAANEC